MRKSVGATRRCEKSSHKGKDTRIAMTRPGRWEPRGRRSMAINAAVSAPFSLSPAEGFLLSPGSRTSWKGLSCGVWLPNPDSERAHSLKPFHRQKKKKKCSGVQVGIRKEPSHSRLGSFASRVLCFSVQLPGVHRAVQGEVPVLLPAHLHPPMTARFREGTGELRPAILGSGEKRV